MSTQRLSDFIFAYAKEQRWRIEAARRDVDYQPDMLFAGDAGGNYVFRKRDGKLARTRDFPVELPPVQEQEPPQAATAEQAKLTVGQLMQMLEPLPRDMLVSEAGLTEGVLAAAARLLALAPAVTRIEAKTNKISKGFWSANSAEALGL